MVTASRVWIACAALCGLIVPSAATDSFDPQAHRLVAMWRGDGVPEPPAPPRMARHDASDPLAIPPLPDEEVDRQPAVPARRTKSSQETIVPYPEAVPFQEDAGELCEDYPCLPFWAHRSYVFGESLLLRPKGNNVPYAISQSGAGGPVNGPVGVIDSPFNTGFRIGFNLAIDLRTSVGVAYSNYSNHAADSIASGNNQGDSLASLLLDPRSATFGATSSFLQAIHDVDFQVADLEYRHLFAGGCNFGANYTFGIRYGKLDQDFQQVGVFDTQGLLRTNSSLKFEGAGLRAGLDLERQVRASNFSLYGKSFINVLFGQTTSSFSQLNVTGANIESQCGWRDERVVPVLEYQVGINWTSPSGAWRTSTGYYAAFWFNAVTTSQFISAAHSSNFNHLGETVAFDGLVSRLEYRY